MKALVVRVCVMVFRCLGCQKDVEHSVHRAVSS